MDIKSQVRIRIDSSDSETNAALKQLAAQLGLPEPSHTVGDCEFFFVMNGDRLELHRNSHRDNQREDNTSRQSPLYVDFLSGAPYYRFINNRTIRQPLAKAAGIKQGYRPTVLDATAGFGEDSFVLAALGCTVTMLERSPLIWVMLDNGISRSRSHPEIGRMFQQRVKLLRTDALPFMSENPQTFDTIFLDPMYPHTSKSSLNKQKMRVLRLLVGDDSDSDRLLHAALSCAAKRVVVKRPARAEILAGLAPSFSITTKSSRYDIYLIPYL